MILAANAKRQFGYPADTRGKSLKIMIRVAVVADAPMYRDGLAELLRHEQALDVLGTAESQDEALELLRRSGSTTNVVIVDFGMGRSHECVRALSKVPGVYVVALGVADVEEQIVSAIEAGASGYVARDASLKELVAMIRSVISGEIICSPRGAAILARRLSTLAANRPVTRQAVLSLREVEVGYLIAEGLRNKEIAARLGIGIPTVKNHVHRILDKLAVESRAEVAAHLPRRVVTPFVKRSA